MENILSVNIHKITKFVNSYYTYESNIIQYETAVMRDVMCAVGSPSDGPNLCNESVEVNFPSTWTNFN